MLECVGANHLSVVKKIMGGKSMKKKILDIGVFVLLVVVLFGLTGCGNKKEDNNGEDAVETNNVNVVEDNKNYFFTVKGEKFNVGDKMADISKVGLKQSSKALSQEVSKNTYVIGGGVIYNESDDMLFSIIPYNPTENTITIADAVIGGVEVGENQYDNIPKEVLDLNIEVYGGIKLGSSYEDVKRVFGETEDVYESESLGYKRYTYNSEQTYRYYEFTVDKNGKVSKIYWKNLVYNY